MTLKQIFRKIKDKNIFPRRFAPYAGALFGLVLFLSLTVSTFNDTVNKRAQQHGIVTRFPSDTRYFFGGVEPETGIVLSWHDNTVRLKSGETTTLKLDAAMYPITVKDRTLVFESSDTNCAEIDSEGNIIAKSPGSVEITVTNAHAGITSKAYLQIIQPVVGFYIQNSSLEMYLTDTAIRVEPIILPQNASNTTVRWYSKDTGIVEVDQTGHLKAVSTGMAEVVGTTADGGYTAKCFVNVINETVRAQSVAILNKAKTDLACGEQRRLIASVLPANTRNKLLMWSSSDETVASVTQNGVITGVNAGEAIITARAVDGVFDSFTVKVTGMGSPSAIGGTSYINSGSVTYAAYNISLWDMAQIQLPTTPKYNDGNGLKTAGIEKVKQYLDPNEFSQGAYKYQFMDLSHYNGIKKEKLAAFLSGKGILSGKADIFIEAARQHNISELYLVAHACLETGYGTSALSTGVNYNGVRVYNMFGIGAYDSNAVATGSKMAYSQGWTTPEAAIMGGAGWISKNYINAPGARQNTLYKMRWNPDNPGKHLYAGDIAWAVTQSLILEKMFAQFTEASISYEVPVYADTPAAVISASSISVSNR